MATQLQVSGKGRKYRTTVTVAGLLVVAMVLAACGSGTKSSNPPSPTTPVSGKPAPVLKTYGNGVTATTVKIGITFVDFDRIKDIPDVGQIRLNQQGIYQAFIDNINAHGGVGGHKIIPVYEKFLPIGTAGLLTICTALTEDQNVFATMGTYYDTSGDAQLCMAKQHQRVLLTFDLTQSMIDASPPGLIVTPGNTDDRSVKIMIDLLAGEHKFAGKTVAVMGNANSPAIVNNSILPELKKVGAKVVPAGMLSISDQDTTTPQSQLDGLIERWKTEKVDTILISSKEAAALEFVRKLRKALPDVQLLADDGEVLSYGQLASRDHITPNPYEGVIVASGPTHQEYENGPNWAYCKSVYHAETGKTAPGPDDIIPYKGGGTGNTLDTYGAINDTCQLMTMFRDIGNKVGQYLNNTNWVNTVNNFGPIEDMGTGKYASLHTGKYEADDNYRLVQFDSSLPPGGNWKILTPLQDIKG